MIKRNKKTETSEAIGNLFSCGGFADMGGLMAMDTLMSLSGPEREMDNDQNDTGK